MCYSVIPVFLRIAYPDIFPVGAVLNQFSTACDGAIQKGNVILSSEQLTDFNDIREYTNKFHHDTNPAYQAESINDNELLQYCEKVMNFIQK